MSPYITLVDYSRQIKSRSGTTATLSGSTIIKEDLTVIRSFSGGTVSGNTLFSGSTNLYDIFSTKSGGNDLFVNVSGVTMTGKLNLPDLSATTINSTSITATTISANTINATNITGVTISAVTISATTLYSGSTDLSTLLANATNVQPGTNISTGGTVSDPVVNLNQNISVNSLSGTSITGTTISAGTISASTIFSGSSNLNTLFVNRGSYRNLWIDAGEMVVFDSGVNPATRYSGASSQISLAGADVYSGTTVNTDNIVSIYFLFTGGTYDQNVQFRRTMPDEWDLGTIKSKIYWDAAFGASVGDGVTWGIKSGAVSNDDSLSGETIFGTEVNIGDKVILPQDLHITSASTSITVGGSPALEDLIIFQISRKVNDANDTMSQDAKLLGCTIQYKELTTNVLQW